MPLLIYYRLRLMPSPITRVAAFHATRYMLRLLDYFSPMDAAAAIRHDAATDVAAV